MGNTAFCVETYLLFFRFEGFLEFLYYQPLYSSLRGCGLSVEGRRGF
jgi:hypothetical protein